MTRALITAGALVVAFLAGRAILRRRAVWLLGRHGRFLAPAVLASVWLVGLVVGQRTGSVTGMSVVGAAVMLGLWAFVHRRFPLSRVRGPRWTHLDWAVFLFVAVVFWAIDLWDLENQGVLVAHFLHGNLPPRALNDPRFPLAYHSIFDQLAAIVFTAAPMDLQTAMGLVSIGCVALTLANLQSLSRLFFRRPAHAQLARVLFVLGFGPVILRCAASGWHLDQMHGQSAQAYVDLIMRRPAGLGFAFFTLALALILPCYATPPGRDAPLRRLLFLLPMLVLMPLMAEEGTVFLFMYLAPLALTRRIPPRTAGLLVLAVLVGATSSGVVLGVLGHGSMATPKFRLALPPRLPTWAADQSGVGLLSRQASGFYWLELGPVFLATLAFALAGRDSRRRAVGLAFLGGALIAVFAGTGAWKRSDLDRFFFYGTPPVFMLAADLPDRVWGLLRRRPGARVPGAVLAAFGVLVCGPSTLFPGWQASMRLQDRFRANALGGELRRNLVVVGPRELVLTTRERADELVVDGFMVIAPMDSNSVGRVTLDHFDEYVRANASRAVWLFLPESDPRVAGQRPVARDGGYVLCHATKGGNPR